jgi:hypothetical protein
MRIKTKVQQLLKNEQGNISLFILGMLGLMMILFVFVLNLGSALSVKEKSATTAQQASMSATSVVYEKVKKVIDEYEYDSLEGEVHAFFKDFDEKIADEKDALSHNGYYRDWSDNELKLEALDKVLAKALHDSKLRPKLHKLLLDADFESNVIETARNAIRENGGRLEGATLTIKKDRIYVKAANEVKSTSYNGFMKGIKKKLYKESAGPKIDFLEDIWNASTTINLN